MAHKILIDKEKYSSSIIDRFEEMRKDDRHCNFIIKVGSEEIQAHRTILCAASDYFDRMLSHDTEENRSGVIEMIGVDLECVKICVDQMYGREVSVPSEKYEKLMYVATMMQLQTLCDGISDLLERSLDSNLFFMAIKIADSYGCTNLEKKCAEFAEENFLDISGDEEFGNLDTNYIRKMINSENVKMSEEDKLDVLLRWVKYNSERRESLGELLTAIDLEIIPAEKLENVMENDSLINNNLTLYRKFNSSFRRSKGVKPIGEGAFRVSESVVAEAIVLFDKRNCHLQRFNPKDNTLTRMQEMNEEMKKTRFTAVLLGDHIYALMRNKAVYRLKYSDKKATWKPVAAMLEEHGSYPPVTAFSRSIYVVGGSLIHFHFFRLPPSNLVEKYDPVENEWTELENKPQLTNGSEILASNGYIYCFGGVSEMVGCGKAVQRFHLDSATWDKLQPMHEERSNAGVIELHGKLYVMGGLQNKREIQSVERYDPEVEKWTMLAPMKTPRSRFRCFFTNGYIYAVGGDANKNKIEKYDVDKDKWEMVNLPSESNLKICDSVIIKKQT